ncbi:OsmC family protein [Gracilibacillus alcaliphilus]|uniref:OsmC family protein n=1 Tax=Gracilibacillus alcaliphilus TaxID=1401441 RepID=UPI00195BE627|nr:OsmC family protein [Gracilibacillus alcaliphilus]MBM7678494.1 putative OsmC-like protein [Gracilibacillus alcaliphilus]
MEFYLKKAGVRADLAYGTLDISGNEDYGYRPYELMVASVTGCIASVFGKLLDKKLIKIDDLKITANVERSPQDLNKITAIDLQFVVKGYRLKLDQLEECLETARENCSVIRTIEDSVKITERLTLINLSH